MNAYSACRGYGLFPPHCEVANARRSVIGTTGAVEKSKNDQQFADVLLILITIVLRRRPGNGFESSVSGLDKRRCVRLGQAQSSQIFKVRPNNRRAADEVKR